MPSSQDLQKVIDRLTNLEVELDDVLESGLSKLERNAMNELAEVLKSMKTGKDGEIKITQENLRKIRKIAQKLDKRTSGKELKLIEKDIKRLYKEMTEMQVKYSLLVGGTTSLVINVQTQAGLENALSLLNRSNISSVQNKVVERLVRERMISKKPLKDIFIEVKELVEGSETGKGLLNKHLATQVKDTITVAQRSIVNEGVKDLGLKWYQFSGSIIRTSRPMCVEMIKHRFFHESEFAGLLKGNVKGVKVSTAGMKEETTVESYPDDVNGWNCRHQMFPTPEAFVPKAIRERIEV